MKKILSICTAVLMALCLSTQVEARSSFSVDGSLSRVDDNQSVAVFGRHSLNGPDAVLTTTGRYLSVDTRDREWTVGSELVVETPLGVDAALGYRYFDDVTPANADQNWHRATAGLGKRVGDAVTLGVAYWYERNAITGEDVTENLFVPFGSVTLDVDRVQLSWRTDWLVDDSDFDVDELEHRANLKVNVTDVDRVRGTLTIGLDYERRRAEPLYLATVGLTFGR